MKKFSIFAVIIVLLLSACSQTTVSPKEVVLDSSYFLSLATKTEEFKSIENLLDKANNMLNLETAKLVKHGEFDNKDNKYHLVLFDFQHDYMFSFNFDKVTHRLLGTYLTKTLINKETSTVSSLDVDLQLLKMTTTIYNSKGSSMTKGYALSNESLDSLLKVDYANINSFQKDIINSLSVDCWDEAIYLSDAEDRADTLWRNFEAAFDVSMVTVGSIGMACGYTGGIACSAFIVAPGMMMQLAFMWDDARDADRDVWAARTIYIRCLQGN